MNNPNPTARTLAGESPRTLPLWPEDSVPSAAEAERAIVAVLAGNARGLDPALAARLQGDLTPAERQAFGEAAPAEGAPLRAAAALRWRLGAAIVTAPSGAVAFDVDAVQSLLADTDALLTTLKKGAEGAAEQDRKDLGAIRSGIVRDAIALGNVVQRLAEASAAGARAPVAKAVQARVLSLIEGEELEEPRDRRATWKYAVVLVLVAALGGGYHVREYLKRPKPAPAIAGAPVGVAATSEHKGQQLIVTPDGRPLADADLARLREAQASRGKQVREVSRGIYVVEDRK